MSHRLYPGIERERILKARPTPPKEILLALEIEMPILRHEPIGLKQRFWPNESWFGEFPIARECKLQQYALNLHFHTYAESVLLSTPKQPKSSCSWHAENAVRD